MAIVIKRINFNPIGGASSAAGVSYDNTTSGLAAANVQAAIDELDTSVDTNTSAISAETTARTNADNTLQANITAEATARSNADTTLQNNVDAEATARATADTTLQTNIDNHVNDTTGAHSASAITNVPSGNLTSDTVQAALDELQTDVDTRATATDLTTETTNRTNADTALQIAIDDHIADTTGAHSASTIANVPTGNLSATDLQSAVDELQTDIDTRALNSDLTTEVTNRTNADTVLQTAIDNHLSSDPAHTAQSISYDNLFSTLSTSSDVQQAIDALDNKIESIVPGTDIEETMFNGVVNNQSTPANVTGFLMDPFSAVGTVKAIVSFAVTYGSPFPSTYTESFDMDIMYDSQQYILSYSSIGFDTGIAFSIDPVSGQVQYTTPNYTDFGAGTIRFRTFGISQ